MYDIVIFGNPMFNDGKPTGPSINAAATAARLGIEQMAIVSSVGEKLTGNFIEGVDKLGIHEYFIVEATKRGAVKINSPSVNHEASFIGVPDRINIRDIPEEFLQTRAILLSPSLQEITAEFVEWICNSTDALVFLDPQLRGLNSEGRLEVIREFSVTEKTQSYLDVIKPNQLESELITGESDPYLAAELIVEWATEICVITLGKKGSLVYDGKDFDFIPSYPTKEVDILGAGDVYLAAFASQLLNEKSLVHCGVFASSLASFKVENQGIEFQLDEKEINHRSETIASMVETR